MNIFLHEEIITVMHGALKTCL